MFTQPKYPTANRKLRRVCWKHSESTLKYKIPDWFIRGSSARGRLIFEQIFLSYLIRCSLEVDFLSGNSLKVTIITCTLFACLNFFGLQTISNLEKSYWHICNTSCIYLGWFMFWAHLYIGSTFTESIQSFKFIFVSQLLRMTAIRITWSPGIYCFISLYISQTFMFCPSFFFGLIFIFIIFFFLAVLCVWKLPFLTFFPISL